MIVPCSCNCCGGDVDRIISVFTKLHQSGFNLEYETYFESVDKWLLIYGREDAKLVVASKAPFLLFSCNVNIKCVFKEGNLTNCDKFTTTVCKR